MKRFAAPTFLALLVLAALPLYVSAQSLRPGLWNMTFQTGDMSASIPPEALAQMKARGIDPSTLAGPRTIQHQSCITPQQAKNNMIPPALREEDQCKISNYERSATSVSAQIACDGKFKGSGAFKAAADSDTSTHGSVDMSGVATDSKGGSHPFEMHSKFSGSWVSSDCGNVAPAQTH